MGRLSILAVGAFSLSLLALPGQSLSAPYTFEKVFDFADDRNGFVNQTQIGNGYARLTDLAIDYNGPSVAWQAIMRFDQATFVNDRLSVFLDPPPLLELADCCEPGLPQLGGEQPVLTYPGGIVVLLGNAPVGATGSAESQTFLTAPRPRGSSFQVFEGFQFAGQTFSTISPKQINQAGQVGFAILGDDGATEIWRATPGIPEPSTGKLLVTGFLLLAWLLRPRLQT